MEVECLKRIINLLTDKLKQSTKIISKEIAKNMQDCENVVVAHKETGEEPSDMTKLKDIVEIESLKDKIKKLEFNLQEHLKMNIKLKLQLQQT